MVMFDPPAKDFASARPTDSVAASADDMLVTKQEFNELKNTLNEILALLKDSKTD